MTLAAGRAGPGWCKWMKGEPWFLDVDTSLSLRKPELRVKIDREKASDLGIPVQKIASTLNVLVGGEPVTKYKELDEQYDVWLRADLAGRDRPSAVAQLMIPSPRAGLVQLSSLAALNPEKGPATIDRYGMQHQVGVTANLRDGVALGDAAQRLADHVNEMGLPIDYRSEFLGKIEDAQSVERQFPDRVPGQFPLHVHDPGGPVRELRPPYYHPPGPAADAALCPGFLDPSAHEPGHLRHVRPVHALRHREEERNPASRLHQRAAATRASRGTKRSWRPTARGCGRF